MLNRLLNRPVEEPTAAPETEPENIQELANQFKEPRRPLQVPQRYTLTAGATQIVDLHFTPDAIHVATPNGAYVLVSQGGYLATDQCWQLGQGGYVLMPGASSQVTLYNSGSASADVIVTPVNAVFDYDPGAGF